MSSNKYIPKSISSKTWTIPESFVEIESLRQQLAEVTKEQGEVNDALGILDICMVAPLVNSLRLQLAECQAALAAKDSFLHWLNGKAGDPPMTLREALAIQPDDTALREWGARLLEKIAFSKVPYTVGDNLRPIVNALRSGEWKPEGLL